jgi:hypothetical protein
LDRRGGSDLDRRRHFNGCLYLFKVEICLATDFDRALLAGRRREVLHRFEPITSFDKTGHHTSMRERRCEYLVLEDCRVDFTGRLRLAFPYGDTWEMPSFRDESQQESETKTMVFEHGEQVG